MVEEPVQSNPTQYYSWSVIIIRIIHGTPHQYRIGYDICWVDLPGHSLGNAATSAEYVAYNIKQLASKSVTGKVFVIGHSQGAGLNIPWVSKCRTQFIVGLIPSTGSGFLPQH